MRNNPRDYFRFIYLKLLKDAKCIYLILILIGTIMFRNVLSKCLPSFYGYS